MSNSAGPKITKDGLVLDFDAANTKSYNFYADPYASNVSLHLKMDGANGSTTFTDSGPNALAVTAVGNAQISTTQSKYNGSAGYFDGSTGYLSLTGNSSFQFGTGDFTVEAWVYNISADANIQQTFLDTRGAATATPFTFGIYEAKLFFYDGTVIQSSSIINSGPGPWYHFAACRSNGRLRLFINGLTYYNASNTTNITTGANTIYIGRGFDSAAYYTNGYIDELKVTKGIAKYTGNFIAPPIPSTFTDLTKNKNIGTLFGGNYGGGIDYSPFNGGSLVFNGTSSYISLGTNSNLNFETGDFTIDCWYKLSATTPNDQGILNDTAGTFSSGSVLFKARQNSSGGKVSLQAYDFSSVGGRILTSSTTIAANIWYNAIVTRIGNSFTLYINGRSESTGTFAGNMNFNNNSGTYIGYSILDAANGYLKGNIPMIKIYKGKGLTSGEVYNNFVANRGRFGV